MVLYHGTTYDTLPPILNCNKILVTNDKTSHYQSEGHTRTRRGYVYLTDSPLAALEFGWRRWNILNGEGMQLLTVFKIEIPDHEIETDPDENEWKSSCFEDAKFYRLNRDINYDTEVSAIAFFQFTSSQACCDYIENIGNYIVWSSVNKKVWNGNAHFMD